MYLIVLEEMYLNTVHSTTGDFVLVFTFFYCRPVSSCQRQFLSRQKGSLLQKRVPLHLITLLSLSLQPQTLKLLWAESWGEGQTEGDCIAGSQDIRKGVCTSISTVCAWRGHWKDKEGEDAGKEERKEGQRREWIRAQQQQAKQWTGKEHVVKVERRQGVRMSD